MSIEMILPLWTLSVAVFLTLKTLPHTGCPGTTDTKIFCRILKNCGIKGGLTDALINENMVAIAALEPEI